MARSRANWISAARESSASAGSVSDHESLQGQARVTWGKAHVANKREKL